MLSYCFARSWFTSPITLHEHYYEVLAILSIIGLRLEIVDRFLLYKLRSRWSDYLDDYLKKILSLGPNFLC